MPRRSPPLRTAPAAVLLAVGLVACGSGSEPAEDAGSPTSDRSPSATSSSSSSSSSPWSSPSSAQSAPSSPSATEPGSGDTSDSAPTSAREGQLGGAGYVLTLPEGWEDATVRFKEYSELIDAGAVNATQSGRTFSDNVNVLRNADQTELPVARAEQQFADELGTVANRVQVQPRVTIGGIEAVHLTGRTDTGEVTALTDQYISFSDGAYYLLTFSYSVATPAAQREREVSSMLASWTWD